MKSFKRMMKEAGHEDSDSGASVTSQTLAQALDDYHNPKRINLDLKVPKKVQEHLDFFHVRVASKADKLKAKEKALLDCFMQRF